MIIDDEIIIDDKELQNTVDFLEYKSRLINKYVVVFNLENNRDAKVIKQSDVSRYFPTGRKRIRAKIYRRLGHWGSVKGLLVTLTFAPGKISREDAWLKVGFLRSEFLREVNQWRQRHGFVKAKCLSVIECQKQTGYPHIHIVFPNLEYLAPLDELTKLWGMENNSVDLKVRNSISPVAYICKYISKLEGWDDYALAYLWKNRTRLYSMSRDYTLPDYSDKRVPAWHFAFTTTRQKLIKTGQSLIEYNYDSISGIDDLMPEIYPDLANMFKPSNY
jgi:hypothetical protein